MRAVVMRGSKLVVDEVPEPEPRAGEVLVRTLACGICGSDLHVLKHAHEVTPDTPPSLGGTLDPGRDVVMGHEFCAEVLDHGPGSARRFAPGTRVCAMPILFRDRGLVTIGYSHDVPGGYAERMVLMEPLLLPVPNGLASEHAALTEPLAVGLHAVEKAQLGEHDVPLVIGCGPVGLAVIGALRTKGVRPIVAADFSPVRRALAEKLGADLVVDPAERSPYSSWREVAAQTRSGRPMPTNPLSGAPTLRPGVYFECVGVPGVLDQMMVGAERGCRFVVVGVCLQPDEIRPLVAINKELSLQFVLAYTPQEFATTLRMIAEGELVTEPLVTGAVGIDETARAFEDLGHPEGHAKILVEPWR